jgi:4-hydroxyphenylacetate 3-monooxygenase
MIKTGAQHLQSLRDGRAIYLNGGLVNDATEHSAFRNAVASVCELYDFVYADENRPTMTFETETGDLANRMWQLPTSYEMLVERRRALETWASQHAGFMGRSPDHVASCLSGMYMGLDQFRAYDKDRAAALHDYFQFARGSDAFLTYVIINPQADRSKAAHEQDNKDLVTGVVDQDSQGITVRGAKMLATSGIMANEVLVTCIQPLMPGDEKYAISFAVPMGTKGLKILSRKSYEEHAGNIFDYPLSNQYDENDALLYFDDVKVPWDRVFINGDVAMCQTQFHGTPAHVFQNYQAQIRLMVKLRFMTGLARRIADINGTTDFPQVREALGQLAAEAAMVEAMVNAMEVKGRQLGDYYVPDRHTLYAAQVLTQQLYGKVISTLRELAGGGMIMLPSSAEDFNNPELYDLIGRTQQSPAAGSNEKVKFYRLAWDAVGSEFASRHTQYEMFYAGAQFVTKGHSFRTYDWDRATGMVDDMLSRYDMPSGANDND